MRTFLACSLMIALAGCGGDDGGGDDQSGTPDARLPGIDGPSQNVAMVACQGGEPLVTTPGNLYSPSSVTVAVGGRVHFMLGTTHNLSSTTPSQGFSLPFGADACLEFRAAGTYTFRCTPHNFTGTVVAQ